jgi:replication factor C large subunit
LDEITQTSRGDLRAAINDLQTISNLEKKDEIIFYERNKEEDIFTILKYIFQEPTKLEALGAFDKLDMSIDEIILWIEENIPKVYKGEELAKAYYRLSSVDLFKGRIYKQQYWRFLVYENALLSYGISASKNGIKKGFFKYMKPDRILKIWLSNQKFSKRKSIAQKYASKTHIGTKRALFEWGEIKNILKNPEVQKQLKLTEEEVEYLRV